MTFLFFCTLAGWDVYAGAIDICSCIFNLRLLKFFADSDVMSIYSTKLKVRILVCRLICEIESLLPQLLLYNKPHVSLHYT